MLVEGVEEEVIGKKKEKRVKGEQADRMVQEVRGVGKMVVGEMV